MSATATRLMGWEEFADEYDNEKFELVEGVPTGLAMPELQHGYALGNLFAHLWHFTRANKLGRMTAGGTGVMTKRNPDTVRGADVCFYSYATIPAFQKMPRTGGAIIVPDLVAEVNSPDDHYELTAVKVDEYLRRGVKVVIVIESENMSATVHRPNELPQVFDNGDDLVIPDLLPGFAVAVKALFEE